MIIHIVTWNLNCENKHELSKEIKGSLELLKGKINGLIDLEYLITPLNGSNKDVMLITKHETMEDLDAYQKNPLHLNLISKYKDYLINRSAFNYEK